MKKHLIAAAVAAAVAAPAFAQNVSISGRIDAGYSMTSATTAAGAKTDTDQITTGVFTTQRLTLSGSEDLGGGLKASFAMESTIAQNRALTFGDRAFNATLSGSFGSIMIGRADSMIKSVFDSYDAGYSNNMVGAIDGLDEATNSSGSRDVTIRYTTPNFSGFTASVGLMKDTVEVAGSPKVDTTSGEEFGLRYSAGPLNAALAYRSVESSTAASAGTAGLCATNIGGGGIFLNDEIRPVAQGETCADAGFPGAATTPVRLTGSDPVARTNTKFNDLGLGVSYNFGPAVVFGQYFDNESKNKVTGAKTDEKFYAVGVRVPLGATTIFASYTDGNTKTGGVKLDREGYQLGLKYDLSKRTYAYLAHGDEEAEASATTKRKADQTAFGIVHLF
jgi:predicted porin